MGLLVRLTDSNRPHLPTTCPPRLRPGGVRTKGRSVSFGQRFSSPLMAFSSNVAYLPGQPPFWQVRGERDFLDIPLLPSVSEPPTGP
jgi:hypothetical protein